MIINETMESREWSGYGDDVTVIWRFVVKDTTDDVAIRDEMLGSTHAPATYQNLIKKDIEISPENIDEEDGMCNVWRVEVMYVTPEEIERDDARDDIRVRWLGRQEEQAQAVPTPPRVTNQFTTSTETVNIKHSKHTVNSFGILTPDAQDFEGAINVENGNILGADVQIPVQRFSIYAELEDSEVEAKRATWSKLAGKVSSDGFMGYGAGEVLFLGFDASQRHLYDQDAEEFRTYWECSFNFAVSERSIPDVQGASGLTEKEGWDYLWVYHLNINNVEDEPDDWKLHSVYYERVYESAPFTGEFPDTWDDVPSDVNIAGGGTFGVGDKIVLTASGRPGPIWWRWTKDGNYIQNGKVLVIPSATAGSAGTYEVEAFNAFGSATASTTVVVN